MYVKLTSNYKIMELNTEISKDKQRSKIHLSLPVYQGLPLW